jgi:hypothetical protein
VVDPPDYPKPRHVLDAYNIPRVLHQLQVAADRDRAIGLDQREADVLSGSGY